MPKLEELPTKLKIAELKGKGECGGEDKKRSGGGKPKKN